MWILDLLRIAERQAMIAKMRNCNVDWRLRHTNIACKSGEERVTIEFIDMVTGELIDWTDASVYRA